MNLFHFRNGKSCLYHDWHGFSCAVDALLDLYYYGIFKFIKGIKKDRRKDLNKYLFDICQQRDRGTRPSCVLREPVWQWLVQNLGNAYHPKGRNDAEIFAGFQELSKSSLFGVELRTESKCCGMIKPKEIELSMLTLSIACTNEADGDIAKAIEIQMNNSVYSSLPMCSTCNKRCAFLSGRICVSDFLIVEIGAVDAKNVQNPPVQIFENINLFGCKFELTSAVLMEPNHFLTAVTVDNGFCILDGVKANPVMYSNFASAVSGFNSLNTVCITSPTSKYGVHILVYRKLSSELSDVPLKLAPKTKSKEPLISVKECIDLTQSSDSVTGHSSGKSQGSIRIHVDQQSINLKRDHSSQHSPGKLSKNQTSSQGFQAMTSKKQGSSPKVRNESGQTKIQKLDCNTDTNQRVHKSAPLTGTPESSCKSHKAESSKQKKTPQSKKKTNPIQTSAQVSVKKEFSKEKKSGNEKEMPVFSETPRVCTEGNNLLLSGCSIPFIQRDGETFLKCPEVFTLLGIAKHLRKEGYKFIDKRLEKLGFNPSICFILSGKRRKYFSINAANALADKNKNSHWKSTPQTIIGVMSSGFPKEKQKNDIRLDKNVSNEDSRPPSSGDTVTNQSSEYGLNSTSGTSNYSASTPHKRKFKGLPRKRLFESSLSTNVGKKKMKQVLRTRLKNCFRMLFGGDKKKMLECFSSLIHSGQKQKDFHGVFSKKDVEAILSGVPTVGKKARKCTNLYADITHSASISADDLIYIQENLSGSRMTEELRRRLPGVIPSKSAEYLQKKQYNREFQAVLLPRRTACGWRIDPHRLTEVLLFHYHGLLTKLKIKIYGDGREIGGRPSTFIALSLLNNELALYGLSYQSPKEIFPVTIFYEKDNRDSLEQNLGCDNSNWLNEFLSSRQKCGDEVFLTGDEMFLEHMLDGSGELSPSSDSGWNIYSKMRKEQKGDVAISGLRTDLDLQVDREHPDSILSCIPVKNTVLCLLHALARSVEKLVTLVVSDIVSKANIKTASGGDGLAYKMEKIANLEENINRRGVRQGTFSISFDSGGNLKPIKLNKDHALTIIAPSPNESCADFRNVLHNVLSDIQIHVNLMPHVKNFLKLPPSFTEYELVSSIWKHFYHMVEILKVDNAPVLKDGKHVGSVDPQDYTWGYTEDDKRLFKYHAEYFYQAFKLKYSAQEFTPYMIKLVDMGQYFIHHLPLSLGRFQAEGGEHVNYMHNSFYYHHTTRHGGKNQQDPIVAIFRNMWKNLCYSIDNGDESIESKEAAELFKSYKSRHLAAVTIQSFVRGALVRRKHMKSGTPKVNPVVKSKPLSNMHFILCGSVPKLSNVSYTQASFKTFIKENGGRVRNKIPGKGHYTTKKYHVLCSKKIESNKKLPLLLHEASRRGYQILDYSFITDCVRHEGEIDVDKYKVNLNHLPRGITKLKSIAKKHFGRANRMISFLKSKQKRKIFVKNSPVKKGNPGLHFVWKQWKEECENKPSNFQEGSARLKRLFEIFKTLTPRRKKKNFDEWQEKVNKLNALKVYNSKKERLFRKLTY
ncbi:hypothetical protein HOLleu_22741 [Holothuria leucospilota]|uniref:BRCT domain-containing protein n=1 Tax=Holothuria leucospilota TaxID=206669 RepID=A0A9Q1BZ00_HOLLE|nr:hypothetical protein HOLleu_22741 [Holothuria leucospilota]